MALPLRPPVLPQLAKSQKSLPRARAGSTSRSGTASARSRSSTATRCTCSRATASRSRATSPSSTFPEGRYVLDGEIVLFDDQGRQDFDALGQRIHPAKSRIDMLAEKTPTRFIAFDLLARRRRARCSSCPSASAATRLEQLIDAPVDLTPASEDPADAQPWLQGAEGVIAKRQEAPYRPGERVGHGQDQARAHDRRGRARLAAGQGGGHARLAQPRALRRRRATCARSATCSGFTAKQKRELPAFLAPYETGERFSRRAEPLERRARDGRRRRAARARRRGDLRPHQQRAHPPRREDPALARRQGPARLHDGAARRSSRLQRRAGSQRIGT